MGFRRSVLLLVTALAMAFAIPAHAFAATAELTVYAIGSGSISSSIAGHAWISVKNTSASTIKVNGLSVPPGYTQHVGSWGNLGVKTAWYNVESYKAAHGANLSGRVSYTEGISSTQLATLSTWIKSNSTWSLTKNCSWFAAGAWNSVAASKVSAGTPCTPTGLAASIKKKSYVTGRSMGTWSTGTLGYYSGSTFVNVVAPRGIAESLMWR